jgi:hypothetical protein
MKFKLMIMLTLMGPGANAQTKWLISESSSMTVNGSTNINKFSCDIPGYDEADTLTIRKNDKDIALTGSINPVIFSFDCHKAMMTRDLRKTLKAKNYPRLHIKFLTLSALPNLSAGPIAITGEVEIEIAGTRKLYTVNYQISEDTGKMIHLLGSRDVNFSDFNLIPPRKLGGIIKTNDQLAVAFDLKMKAI